MVVCDICRKPAALKLTLAQHLVDADLCQACNDQVVEPALRTIGNRIREGIENGDRIERFEVHTILAPVKHAA